MKHEIHWSHRLCGVACAVATMLGMVDSAGAGTYVIRNCNVPGERGQPKGWWDWNPVPAGTFGHDDCASGGGFGISAGTIPWGVSTGVVLATPPGIAIRRVRLWLVVKLRSTGSQLFSVVTSGNATMANPADLFGAPGGSTLASPYVSPLLHPDTNRYYVLVNCAGGTGEPCGVIDTDVLDIRGVETTLEETAAPVGSIDGGELLTPGPQSGVRTLAYTADDPHSGVARVSAIIGKTVVGSVDFAADCAYAAPAACPQSRNGMIAADTRMVPDGIYPVSLRVTDAAGDEQTAQASTAVQVSNATTTGQSTTSAAPGDASLSVSFAANRRSSLTAGYGRAVVIRGRLRARGGVPISGATIDVEERPALDLARTNRKTVGTGHDGVFTYAVPRGTSRTLTFTYRGASAVARRLRLRVKAAASLRVALNGTTVRYGGRVLSEPLPPGGKLVEIQGRAPRSPWTTFAQRRTDRRGDFFGTYRLRIHRPGVRLQFRVRIPTERRYPFVAHNGSALTRRVR